MDTYYPLLITSAMLLLPLIPAGIIYLLLTPGDAKNLNKAKGEYQGQFLSLGKIRVEFNVFGSTATYALVLLAAYYMHSDMESQKIQILSMQDQQAWLVEVPVRLKDVNGTPLQANNEEMQQVMVTLEPGNIEASASTLQFWVVPDKGRFPTANFSMPGARNRVTLDLNNKKIITHKYASRKMEGIVPVWLDFGEAYGH